MKYVRCFPRYTQVYCTTKSCPCRDFGNILKVHFELCGTQDMVKENFIPLLTWPTQVSNLFGVGRWLQIYRYKNGLAMGVTIGGDAEKSGNNTHLLVIMRVRLSQKISLLDMTNRIRFKKGNGWKIRTKSVSDYW